MKYNFNEEEHLHTLDDKPLTGTSSISNVLAKPLTWWSAGLAVSELGWSNPKLTSKEARIEKAKVMFDKINFWGSMHDSEGVEAYLELLDKGYKAHSVRLKSSAVAGTDLHAELEKFVKAMMGSAQDKLDFLIKTNVQIQPFIDWSDKNVKRFLGSEVHCYDEELWVGGIVDCVAELKDGKIAVIDFKSAKDAYPTHFLQCAGYQIQLEANGMFTPDGELIGKLEKPVEALIVIPFGATKVEPVTRYDVDSYKSGFKSAVNLYRLLKLEGQ